MRSQKQFGYTGPRVPLLVRLLNIAARHTNSISDRLNRLDSHELLESACRKTRLNDWGDQRFKNALDVLVNSVAKGGELTFFGRLTLRQFLVANLCQRLNIVETCKRFPEIGQHKIQRPIFITGWYRTGSTYLHNLLASHPSVRAPLFWELRYPCPALDPRTVNPKKIIRKTHRISRIHRYLSPGFSDIHDMQAEKPEECLHLFENAILGTTGFFITEAKEYAWWLLSHEVRHAYDFYKTQLQLLNWQRPGQRWLLKWPYHLWHLDALWKTFPDATVVQLHRNPVEAIGSVCSLAASARSAFCTRIDNVALGRFWMDYNDAGLRRGFKERESHAADQIADVRYADLMEDPIAVLHRILESVDLGSDSLWFHSLRRRLKGLPKNKLSRHRYTLSQFGLDPGKIRQRFGGYMADYDLNNV